MSASARRAAPRACPECDQDRPVSQQVVSRTAVAYVQVRAVRLLQARGVLPGHGGLVVGGLHVHHLVHGAVLVLGQHVVGARRQLCLHRAARINVLCTGLALLLDEFDLLTSTQGSAGARRARRAVDLGACVLAVRGARGPGGTGWADRRQRVADLG